MRTTMPSRVPRAILTNFGISGSLMPSAVDTIYEKLWEIRRGRIFEIFKDKVFMWDNFRDTWTFFR